MPILHDGAIYGYCFRSCSIKNTYINFCFALFSSCSRRHRRAHKSTWTHGVKSSQGYTQTQPHIRARQDGQRKVVFFLLFLLYVQYFHIHYKCTFRVASTSTRTTIWSHIISATISSHRDDRKLIPNAYVRTYVISIDFYSIDVRTTTSTSCEFLFLFRIRINVFYCAVLAKFMAIRIMHVHIGGLCR